MPFFMKKLTFIFTTLAILPNIAHAYIDPGSGSAIMAAVMFGSLAASMYIKSYWYKLKALVSGKKNNPVALQQEKKSTQDNKKNVNKNSSS